VIKKKLDHFNFCNALGFLLIDFNNFSVIIKNNQWTPLE